MTEKQRVEIVSILLILLSGMFLFIYLNDYLMVLIFAATMTIIAYTVRKEYVIFLFVFFLPFGPFVNTEHNLFGVIGVDEIISFAAILYFIETPPFSYKKCNKYQKLVIRLVIIIAFIEYYGIVKGVFLGFSGEYLGLSDEGYRYIFKKLINFVLLYYPLLSLIKLIKIRNLEEITKVAVYASIILLVITAIFHTPLQEIGFHISDIVQGEVYGFESFTRKMGLYLVGGDENSFGAFCAIALGYYLAQAEKTSFNKYLPVMFFALLGIFISGSRISMISLSLILLLYFNRNYNNASNIKLVLLALLFFLSFSSLIIPAFSRFYDKSTLEHLDPNELGRVGKWIRYTDFMVAHPNTFIIGNLEEIDYKRVPHNCFVKIAYDTGLIFLLLFLIPLYKIFRASVKYKNNDYMLYYLIPFVGVLMTLNSNRPGIFLFLFIAMNYPIIRNKLE